MEPEHGEPKQIAARITAVHAGVAVLSLLVPGMATSALVALSQGYGIRPWGHWGAWIAMGILLLFLLLVIGCCVFSAWILVVNLRPENFRRRWIEWSFLLLFAEVVLVPLGAMVTLTVTTVL